MIEFTHPQPSPVAVIVADAFSPPAVKVTLFCVPVLGEIVPPVSISHVAAVPVTVIVTSSTTPTFVLVRSAGEGLKVCDAIVVNMVDVGEETGDLDKMLMKIADNYDNDVDVLVGSLISILEPVMVVILGLIVGFIVIALFAPMITLIQSVSGGPGKK